MLSLVSQKKAGFTLIETIIYIALFGLLIGGALSASYSLFEGADTTQTKATIQEEANFVLRKINWALTGVETVLTPSSGYYEALSVQKYDGTNIAIQKGSGVDANKIVIIENGGSPIPITTDNVTVGNLGFYHIQGSGGIEGISASTTISGFVASTTKYIRQ